MSISPVGNSDAYARYRQQALDLLASSSQSGTQSAPTTGPSYVTPSDPDQSSSNPFATKFKADLSALNSSHNDRHAHGTHAHHHHAGGADPTTADSTTQSTDQANATSVSDPFSQALDQFADVLKSAAAKI